MSEEGEADGGQVQPEEEGPLPAPLLLQLQSLPDWVPPVAGGGIGFLLLFGLWLVVRFVHYTGKDLTMKRRMIAESEAARLEERRREVESLLASKGDWMRVVGQVIADGMGRPVQLDPDLPPRVGGKPVPYFTVTGEEGERYIFTTDTRALQRVGLLKKRVRPVRLGVSVETVVVWTHLAERYLREARETIPAVPRGAEWFLVAVE